MGLKFEGLREFREAFERLREQAPEKLSEASREHLQEVVFPQSQTLVPELTGALKETGRVVPGAKPRSWQIKYGNSPVEDRSLVDYAAAVHEREATHEPPTGYKFLSRPLNGNNDLFKERAAKKLDDLAGEG